MFTRKYEFRSNTDKWDFLNSFKAYYEDNTNIKISDDAIFIYSDNPYQEVELQLVVNTNINNIKIGDIVRHFKGYFYKIIGECIDSETEEEMFIYIALYDDYKIWCRPKCMFYDILPVNENKSLLQPYRFIKVDKI